MDAPVSSIYSRYRLSQSSHKVPICGSVRDPAGGPSQRRPHRGPSAVHLQCRPITAPSADPSLSPPTGGRSRHMAAEATAGPTPDAGREPGALRVLRHLDLVVMAVALPIFLAAGLPLLGWAAASGAWLAQRAIQV